MLSRVCRAALAVIITGMALISDGVAQTVIDRPARIIVGFPPGGSADLVARLLATQLKGYAPSVIVENKPGAGGRIALDVLKNAPADGTAILLTPGSMLFLYPHVFKSLPYDPLADFTAIAPACQITLGIAAGPKVPPTVKSLADLIAWFKANPKEAAIGFAAAGSSQHFSALQLIRSSGLAITEVPYKGGGVSIQDLLSGQIPAIFAVPSTLQSHHTSGKARILATTGRTREINLPDVPIFAEVGFPELIVEEWFGVVAPAKMQPALAARIAREIRAAFATPEVKEGLRRSGLAPLDGTPEDLDRLLRASHATWGARVKAFGYKPED